MRCPAIRQGDLLLVRLRGLPKGAKARREALLRIPGEEGKAHSLEGARLFENNGRAIAVVDKEGALQHEDHPQMGVPQGVWELRTSREYIADLRDEDEEWDEDEETQVWGYSD